MSAMRLTLAGLGIAAVAAALFGAYRIGERQGMSESASAVPGSQAPAASNTEGRILYWHDPMVPGQRFDKPGKSPFMDMPLVPVYADEAQGAGVAINPTISQNLGVRTAIVRRGPVQASIEAQGVVTQNERATVVVQSRAAGYVEKLYVRAALDPVAKGQPLATLFVPDWSGALAEYAALRKSNVDPSIVAAARERLKLLSIPDEAVNSAEHQGRVQSRYTLTAPIGGVVAEIGAREGVQAQPGMMLFRIVDLSSVWVEANVAESQAGLVRAGIGAEAKADAYPARTFSGKVTAVLPQVDPATRTLRVRIELANPGTALKPGMFVRVGLQLPSAGEVLLVPQEAIIATGKRDVVILANDGNRFEPREVKLGRPVGNDIEVTNGLSAGQRIVTSSQFLIDSEASLKSALPRLGSQPLGATPSPNSYHAEGVVEAVDQNGVTISHGPVAALQWPAMTMEFRNPAGGPRPSVKAGDHVAFDFVQRQDAYELVAITPAHGGKP